MLTFKQKGYTLEDYEYILDVLLTGTRDKLVCNNDCQNCRRRHACSDLNSLIGYTQRVITTKVDNNNINKKGD